MTKFVGLRSKTYAYLTDDFEKIKKNKKVKTCVVETELKFNQYKDCLFNNNVILKSQQRFKSELHDVITEEVNKIALKASMIKEYGFLTKLHHILMDTKESM